MTRIRVRAVLTVSMIGLAGLSAGCSTSGSPSSMAADWQARSQNATLAQNQQARGLSPQADSIAQSVMTQTVETPTVAGVPEE